MHERKNTNCSGSDVYSEVCVESIEEPALITTQSEQNMHHESIQESKETERERVCRELICRNLKLRLGTVRESEVRDLPPFRAVTGRRSEGRE